jgi:methionine-rich copper-binding protein CopC
MTTQSGRHLQKDTRALQDERMMLRKTIQAILAMLMAVVVSGGVAQAHPALETADPRQGATVSSPTEVRLTFSEDLIAKFSGLTVKDQSGRLVETASPTLDPNHKRQLIV